MNDRLYEILMSDNVIESINNNLNELLTIIPELKDMINFPHNHPHHHLDVWNHTLLALSISPQNFEIRLVLLLHDIGKPHSYQDEEIRHFRNHAKMSYLMSESILQHLKLNGNLIEEILYLIREHDTPMTKEDIENNYDLSLIRYQVQYCDALAHNPDKLEKRLKYLEEVEQLLDLEEEIKLIKKPVEK